MAVTVTSLREITPGGKLKLHFHDGQWRTWNSPARFIFMLAGSQGGKTSFGPHWLHREIEKARAKLGIGERSVGDFLAITSTYDLFKLKMLPEMREVFENILGIGRYWAGEKLIELTENLIPGGRFLANRQDDPMYGRIILRSAESPSGLEATTAKAAWLDEVGQPEFTLGAWEAILRRLALYQGKVLGTTTIYNFGWLKMEVFDKWMVGNSDFDVIQFDSTANPAFPKKEYERARQTLPSWKFDMFYRGRFVRPAGLVYSTFDESQCVIDRFPVPNNWLWYVGHDFGGANPAALFYAYDPGTHIFYLVDEYLPGAVSTAEQVETFKEKTRNRVVIRRAGGSHQEEDARRNYTAHGWPIAEPSLGSVDVGIERVFALHSRNAIMAFRDCKNYLNEKMSYSYKLGEGYQIKDEIENKSRYHLMDAERYILGGFFADDVSSRRPQQSFSVRF